MLRNWRTGMARLGGYLIGMAAGGQAGQVHFGHHVHAAGRNKPLDGLKIGHQDIRCLIHHLHIAANAEVSAHFSQRGNLVGPVAGRASGLHRPEILIENAIQGRLYY